MSSFTQSLFFPYVQVCSNIRTLMNKLESNLRFSIYFGTQTEAARNRTTNLSVSTWPTLPPELPPTSDFIEVPTLADDQLIKHIWLATPGCCLASAMEAVRVHLNDFMNSAPKKLQSQTWKHNFYLDSLKQPFSLITALLTFSLYSYLKRISMFSQR